MVGEAGGRVVQVPLRETWERRPEAAEDLLGLVRELV
jgi:hypothetical protein